VLRDEQGTVHVFANGEIKTLANMSKDFSYYVISVGVAYEDDPDRVVQALNDAGRIVDGRPGIPAAHPRALEVYGIDAFESDRLVVKGRIKTVPQKQWLVGRELRKRIARLLREARHPRADAAGDFCGKCRKNTGRETRAGSAVMA
jgi:small conductance mechanosensitive channel